MSQTQLPKGRFLHRQGEPIETIYFPWGGVCSLTQTMDDGRMAELATVGTEGVVGYLAGFGETIASHDAMVQIPNGGAHTLPVHHFRAEMAQRGLLHDLVSRYMLAAHSFLAASVACNGLHDTVQRTARWLLTAHDRVGRDEFILSHEFLAIMLAVHRPSATIAAGTLQAAGLISYRRAKMRILDRERLEEASCECYSRVRQRFEELMLVPKSPALATGQEAR